MRCRMDAGGKVVNRGAASYVTRVGKGGISPKCLIYAKKHFAGGNERDREAGDVL